MKNHIPIYFTAILLVIQFEIPAFDFIINADKSNRHTERSRSATMVKVIRFWSNRFKGLQPLEGFTSFRVLRRNISQRFALF